MTSIWSRDPHCAASGWQEIPSGEPAAQMLSHTSNDKKDDVLPLLLLAKPGTVQRFTLSFNGGKVLVDRGNDSKSFPLQERSRRASRLLDRRIPLYRLDDFADR